MSGTACLPGSRYLKVQGLSSRSKFTQKLGYKYSNFNLHILKTLAVAGMLPSCFSFSLKLSAFLANPPERSSGPRPPQEPTCAHVNKHTHRLTHSHTSAHTCTVCATHVNTHVLSFSHTGPQYTPKSPPHIHAHTNAHTHVHHMHTHPSLPAPSLLSQHTSTLSDL